MRTIAADILAWSCFSQPHGYDFNGFLIGDRGAGNLAIDPVEPTEQVLHELTQRGVSRILLTNRNHVRAANRVRASTGARTGIHAGDAAHARSQGAVLDDELEVGGKIGPLTVIGVPGKSAGEVAFHWPERRLLIVGDAIVGNPPGRLGLLREQVLDDPARLRESVRRLLSLEFDTLLVGDGECVLHDARERLRELVATFPD
jgi:glyoxylase-like metal-dependent hydrolase (beta-lactamase superfamily II)